MTLRKTVYSLKIPTESCSYIMTVNGCFVEMNRDDFLLSMKYPINQWLQSGENKIDVSSINTVYPFNFKRYLASETSSVLVIHDPGRQEDTAQILHRRNMRAILLLLDEMVGLVEGDLTVRATVSDEEITGAIADSFNYCIDELRLLVAAINNAAVDVSLSLDESRAIASRSIDSSAQQAQRITSASSAITNMANSMEVVSDAGDDSVIEAYLSLKIAQYGAGLVRKNITSMDTTRELIQETSKRIKQLGESSQKIADVVGGITEITDQSKHAIKQIEELANTIQSDINEVVSLIEISVGHLVDDAKVIEDIGEAFIEIEKVSNELVEFVTGISTYTNKQASLAMDISDSMDTILAITLQATEDTEETFASIENLSALANTLRKTVSRFTLTNQKGTVRHYG